MFYKNLIVFSLLIFSSFSAFAQGTYLERALATAQKELADVNSSIASERSKADDYQVCVMNEHFARKRSAEWFVSHYSEFEALSRKIDTVVAETNTKIEALREESVSVVPLEQQGAGGTEVKISLSSMIDYFKLYNSRMKTCKKELRPELERQMEDPRRNDLNLAHSQVVAAMKMMTINLNASLVDHGVHYELAFEQAESGYQLELRVNIDFNGTKQDYKFSLLSADSQTTKVVLTEEAKWSALIAKGEMIDNYPVDALKRFAVILKEERGSCEEIPMISKHATSGNVFDTYSNLMVTGKKWITKGEEIVLANGHSIGCEELKGSFMSDDRHGIEILDACNLKSVKLIGQWNGVGKTASWNKGAIDTLYDSDYILRFTPIDADTIEYFNTRHEFTLVLKRIK